MKRSVSVPLRGLWFLSFFDNLDDAKAAREAFPSPCGDYGSYQLRVLVCLIKAIRVSVPLRGLWFLSFEIDIDDE